MRVELATEGVLKMVGHWFASPIYSKPLTTLHRRPSVLDITIGAVQGGLLRGRERKEVGRRARG